MVKLLLGALCLSLLPGCEKAMRNMYEQPKYDPLSESSLWPDGQSARPIEPNVVVRSAGVFAASSSGRRGDLGQPARTAAPVTIDTLRRGRERYDIYCAPCHSVSGDGDGMVVRRGFPAPASLHTPLMRAATDAHLFDVITNGSGMMYPFAERIGPSDRWAIVDYVRALQRTQHASIHDVPQAEQRVLLEEAP
jgi:mono/diheme cytochrome c family protein